MDVIPLTPGTGPGFTDLFDEALAEFECDQDEVRRETEIQEAKDQGEDWTPDQHKAYLLRRRSRSALEYPLIQRQLIVNSAFLSLSGAAVKLLLLCHEAVWWEVQPKPKRSWKRKNSGGKPGTFQMSYGRAIAAGVGKSRATVAKCFRELIAFKFIAVVHSELGQANTYKLAMGYRKISENKALEIKEALNRPVQKMNRSSSKLELVRGKK